MSSIQADIEARLGDAERGAKLLPHREKYGSPRPLGVNLAAHPRRQRSAPGRPDCPSAEPKPGSSGQKPVAMRDSATPAPAGAPLDARRMAPLQQTGARSRP